jgi:hypothetical protein
MVVEGCNALGRRSKTAADAPLMETSMATRPSTRNGKDWIEWAKLAPQLLWIALATVALILFAADFRALLKTDEISKIG